LENRLYEEKQMTVWETPIRRYPSKAGASSTKADAWNSIDWKAASAQVKRLQVRIAKAYREGKHGKVKSLQWLLTHSFYAKALTVKRVTSNKGASTPGVDKVVWRTPKQKLEAMSKLKRRGYKAQPLRRIYIPKKQKANSDHCLFLLCIVGRSKHYIC
jgi:RNA-directed DNA polymerase